MNTKYGSMGFGCYPLTNGYALNSMTILFTCALQNDVLPYYEAYCYLAKMFHSSEIKVYMYYLLLCMLQMLQYVDQSDHYMCTCYFSYFIA